MQVIGQGGTGKTVLIEAITETFVNQRHESSLAKCATSGIAAIPIRGLTVHFWIGIGIHRPKTIATSNKRIQERRKKNILGKTCLIIDEMSMLNDTLLANVAKIVAHVKKAGGEGDEHLPFAGMHVILMGDFHQFPPVANPHSALYSQHPTTIPDALHGRWLFRQFETVVWLQRQIRIKDIVWTNILSRLRIGQCNDDDIRIIRSLTLNHPDCPKTDFEQLPWSEAVLVTTRNAVREAWNAACLKRHCRRTGNHRYLVPSEDYHKGSGKPLSNGIRLLIAGLKEKDTKNLSDRIEIAVGMKAMIKVNVSTEGEVANGTRGTIRDIILDPREEAAEPDDDGTITLKYPPALIMFEPDAGSQIFSAFIDKRQRGTIEVPNGMIPITPFTVNFVIILWDGSKISVVRRQYAVTGGYAFTDFKAQGQTIEVVIIDLRDTPTGKISPFSAYVALSRSRGRNTIRLLGDFDERLFKRHPNQDLAVEMERLGSLAENTAKRFQCK